MTRSRPPHRYSDWISVSMHYFDHYREPSRGRSRCSSWSPGSRRWRRSSRDRTGSHHHESRDRPGALRLDRRLARRVLPRREDRVHRQPDHAHRRRVRAAGGRPAADAAARSGHGGAHPHDGPRRHQLHAAQLRVLARSRARGRSRSREPSTAASPPRPWRLNLAITSGGATRTETRDLPEAPVVSQNLSRLLANKRLVPGTQPRVDGPRSGDAAERQGRPFASAIAPSSEPTTPSCRRSAWTWIFAGCRRRRG